MWKAFLEWWNRPVVEEDHQLFFDVIAGVNKQERLFRGERDRHVELAQLSEKFLSYDRAAAHWAAAAYYELRLKA